MVNSLGNLPRNSVVRLTDGSPCVVQVPSYFTTHIMIIIIIASREWVKEFATAACISSVISGKVEQKHECISLIAFSKIENAKKQHLIIL